jgi:energy-coupling factor transport system ATP-binding protein
MIILKNIFFSYDERERKNGLHNINLSIRKGEVVLLCGESGCGKTTLTRLINGLIPNYYEGKLRGEVYINDKEIMKFPLYETAKLVGSVFQNPRSQFFNVDTTSEIAFGCENKGLPIKEINRRITETVADFKIKELINRSIFHLSGGEKQKIACASVSACYPDIFVLDEPSSNLDTTAIEDLRELIKMWKSRGKTIVIAEHRLYFLRELVDRILYMKKGTIEREFNAEEMKKMSASEITSMGLRPLFIENITRSPITSVEPVDNLTISNFVFSYKGQTPAINIDSQNVPQGSIIAIIGSNGAGKSTFARCLCGLNKCKGIIINKGQTYKRKHRLKYCYMVMQDVNHQLFTESVFDEVLLSMKEQNMEMAERILIDLDLISIKELHPMSLSGGQKQRVAIASAIASDKEIIIFDEPTSGLDLKHMKEVSYNLKQLQKIGKTLFVISHDIEFIFSCCTHVLHLKKGKVLDFYLFDKNGEKKLKTFFIENTINEEVKNSISYYSHLATI